MTTLTPLTDNEGFIIRYGVAIAELGEDGEWIVALGKDGKHRRRDLVVRAFSAYDGLHEVDEAAIGDLREVWAIRAVCDCGNGCSWHAYWANVTAKTPGAFPMTVLER